MVAYKSLTHKAINTRFQYKFLTILKWYSQCLLRIHTIFHSILYTDISIVILFRALVLYTLKNFQLIYATFLSGFSFTSGATNRSIPATNTFSLRDNFCAYMRVYTCIYVYVYICEFTCIHHIEIIIIIIIFHYLNLVVYRRIS